jgi:hypothetical protein
VVATAVGVQKITGIGMVDRRDGKPYDTVAATEVHSLYYYFIGALELLKDMSSYCFQELEGMLHSFPSLRHLPHRKTMKDNGRQLPLSD